MKKVMFTIQGKASGLGIEDVCRLYGFHRCELDEEFGVIEVDPEQHIYTVLVDQMATERITGNKDVSGPFANPPIAPFGPVEE